MNDFFTGLWAIVKDVAGFFAFVTIIEQYEEGVVLRAGKFYRVVKPGWRLIMPFTIDQVKVDNVVPTTMSLDRQSLTTRDGKSIVIDAFLTWKIIDIRRLILEVENANDALKDAASGYIAEQVASHTWAQVRQADFPNKLKKHVQKQARKWGIGVTNVQFSDCVLSRSYRLWTNS